MYVNDDPPQFFPDRTYVEYLKRLPPKRGLLLNLLFSRDTVANPRVLEPTADPTGM